MNRPIIFEYLELACTGWTPGQIAKHYRVNECHIRNRLLMVSRRVGRLGFWKFHIRSMDEINLRRADLLQKAIEHGLIEERREAA